MSQTRGSRSSTHGGKNGSTSYEQRRDLSAGQAWTVENVPHNGGEYDKLEKELSSDQVGAPSTYCSVENNTHSMPTSLKGKVVPVSSNRSSAVAGMPGDLVTIHRKVHLFDIDIPGKIIFKVPSPLA